MHAGFPRTISPLAFALAVSACDCKGTPVPFGLDAGRDKGRQSSATVTQPSPANPLEPLAREFPEGLAQVDIEGAPIAIESRLIRFVLAFDADQDGDRDAIVVTLATPEAPSEIAYLRRTGSAFIDRSTLATSSVRETDCRSLWVAGNVISNSHLSLAIDWSCPSSNEETRVRRERFAISLTREPRVLERFVLRSPEGATDAIELASVDADEDGHQDLELQVSLNDAGSAAARFVFFDRSSGLARDTREPEATLAALARDARRELRRHPERALQTSGRARLLWSTVCRESDAARLEVGTSLGLACSASASLGRALSIEVQAAARSGDALRAIAVWDEAQRVEGRWSEADREAARASISALEQASAAIHIGPEAVASTERGARLSSIFFEDEDHVRVRTGPPRILDLDTSSAALASEAGDSSLAIVDPSGRFRAVAVERRCEGTVVLVAEVGLVVGLSPPRPVFVAPRPTPIGVPCPDMTPSTRADADGWRVMGWAPLGLLLSRGLELRAVPLDVSAQPVAAPLPIEGGASIPAPIAPGPSTATGDRYVLVHELGLQIFELAPTKRASFLRPAGWPGFQGTHIDAAISPSGRRVAWIAGGRLAWIER